MTRKQAMKRLMLVLVITAGAGVFVHLTAASSKVSALAETSVLDLADYAYNVVASGPTSGRITWSRVGGLLSPALDTCRLTVVSGNAAPTTDQTAKGTLYLTSTENDGSAITTAHCQITIYDGTRSREYDVTELSLSLTGLLTNARPHDVWVYDNAGTLTLEVLAWTNATTRATALAYQSGTTVKTGATTRRWIGTIYATGTGTTEDSTAKRFVWNAYNQLARPVARTADATSWNYSVDTWEQARNSSVNQIAVVVGKPTSMIQVVTNVLVHNSGIGAGVGYEISIGEDSSTAPDSLAIIARSATASATTQGYSQLLAGLNKTVPTGYHEYRWLERSDASGTTTWYGNDGSGTLAFGMSGTSWN